MLARDAASLVGCFEKNIDVILKGVMEGRKTFANTPEIYTLLIPAPAFSNMSQHGHCLPLFALPAFVAHPDTALSFFI